MCEHEQNWTVEIIEAPNDKSYLSQHLTLYHHKIVVNAKKA
jgi:hypothetical protein